MTAFTRRSLLAGSAAAGAVLSLGAPARAAFPSIGHVEKDGARYRLVPVAWNPVI